MPNKAIAHLMNKSKPSEALDFSKPEVVLNELFDDDEWVKEDFKNNCSAEIMLFSEAMAIAFQNYSELEKFCGTKSEPEQSVYVAAFTLGVIDDLVTSMKLMISGKLIPSGNLMRQSIEGLALATLCSSQELLLIKKGKRVVQVKYWRLVRDCDKQVSSHRALEHLELNRQTLHVNADILEDMKRTRKVYNAFSHPSVEALVSRVAEHRGNPTNFIGGNFDLSKLGLYKQEINRRAGFCKILPSAIRLLMKNLN